MYSNVEGKWILYQGKVSEQVGSNPTKIRNISNAMGFNVLPLHTFNFEFTNNYTVFEATAQNV